MNKKYIVRLTKEERSTLREIVDVGKAEAGRIKHANILLKVDVEGPCWSDEQASDAFGCHANTVRNVRQRFVEQGFDAALERKKQERPSRTRILDGAKEAKLISLACSQPPKGRACWTMQLLADRLVELEIVDAVSPKTVERTLKKTNYSRIVVSAG